MRVKMDSVVAEAEEGQNLEPDAEVYRCCLTYSQMTQADSVGVAGWEGVTRRNRGDWVAPRTCYCCRSWWTRTSLGCSGVATLPALTPAQDRDLQLRLGWRVQCLSERGAGAGASRRC